MTEAMQRLIDANSAYSFPQLSRKLHVALSTVWRWHLSGKLPSSKVGGRRYSTSEDLRQFVANCNRRRSDGREIRTPAAVSRASKKAAEILERSGW